jgi:hypothetical protein
MINTRKNIVVGNPNNPTANTYIDSAGTTTSVAAGNQGVDKEDTMITNPNSEGEGDRWEHQDEQPPIDSIVANPNSEGRDDNNNNDDGRVDNSIATNNNDDESDWSLIRSRPTKKPTRVRTPPPRTSVPTTLYYDDDDNVDLTTLTTVTPSVIETPEPSITPSTTPCDSRKWYLQVVRSNDGMTEGSVTTCTNGYDTTTTIDESSKYDTFLECCEGEAIKNMDYTDCKYVNVCNNPTVPKPSLTAIIDDDDTSPPPTLYPSYLATATTSSTIIIVNAMSSEVNNNANSNLNWYDSLKEKVGTTSNGFMIVLIASSAILVITIIVAFIIDHKRQKTRQQEHDLLQNQSSPSKGIVASMIDQVLGQSMLLPKGCDVSVTSSDDDDDNVGVSSYNNGSVQSTEVHFDVYAPPGKLGLILDDSPGGGAMIYTCKEGSTLQSKVQYGDVIIAVNDKDVQHMTAIQVSKLLAKKSGHRLRKISIVRYDIA